MDQDREGEGEEEDANRGVRVLQKGSHDRERSAHAPYRSGLQVGNAAATIPIQMARSVRQVLSAVRLPSGLPGLEALLGPMSLQTRLAGPAPDR
jgi:hypothetical protein